MSVNEKESIEKLNQIFFDYVSYLVFMAKQIIGPSAYGHFALVKALDKVLEIQKFSGEIKNNEFYDQLRSELKSVEGVSSSELDVWEPFLDRLIELFMQKVKTNST